MRDIKVATLNVQTVSNAARFDNLYSWIQSQGIDIALLQETFVDEDLVAKYEHRCPLVSKPLIKDLNGAECQ
ncbi:hypothetical protein N7535_008053 [Penicillium sp. DV-2018c]|nr:hypothetical protein N7461_004089 [Penicillium sp. DV-2018c]KAJ5566415.1 hypothetical protein N7535_008053 [Penicillium sp. DV-2018c]